uniref:Ig-like domain-containing protein n=1 Tax=Cyprinus carpio TaxID=7962 RepID=A0A8C2CB33_CYPCA
MFSGCDLVENRRTVVVTGYSGESVVLPCSCTELLAKPEHIQWLYLRENQYKEIYPSKQIENYKNRVKMFNPNTPGNLSLHISALTTEDQGHYQCVVSSQQVLAVRLRVEGCIVSNEQQTIVITGYTGASVVLPCSCADPQSTVRTFTWYFHQGNQWIQVFQDEKYSGRRVLFDELSPTNLSLLISDLRTNDQGYYKCMTETNIFTDVILTVKEKTPVHTISLTTHQPSHLTQDSTTLQLELIPQHHTPQFVFILLGVFCSVLFLALLAFIRWRCIGSRNAKKVTTDGEELKREQDDQDDVMYSTVVHVKTASTPAHTHSDPAELTEYASINIKP